jgi:hypothetical protein
MALDFENIHTAESSIKSIFGLQNVCWPSLFDNYTSTRNKKDYPISLMEYLKNIGNQFEYSTTNWFHFTRRFREEKYSRGLLPLGPILDFLWERLYRLSKQWVSQKEWETIRIEIEDESNYSKGSILYRGKLEDIYPQQSGPYGLLIYNVPCFDKSITTLEYLTDGSEMVYHICDYFQESRNHNLFELYLENTIPCAVKFTNHCTDEQNLEIALKALYYTYIGKTISLDSNPLTPGRGTAVKPEQIIKIIDVN